MKPNNFINSEIRKYMILTIFGYDQPNEKYLDKFPIDDDLSEDLNKNKDVYNKMNFILNKYRKLYPNVRYFSNQKMSLYYSVIESSDEVIFAFRGTKGLVSWMNNFKTFINKGAVVKTIENGSDKNDVEELKAAKVMSMSKMNNSLRNIVMDEKIHGIEDFKFNNIFEYCKLNKSKMYFHSGFVHQYNALANQLNKQVDHYIENNKIKRISFIGHSLGAVLAQLAFISQNIRAPEFNEKFFLAAYGAPKLGNKKVQEFTEYVLNPNNNQVYFVEIEKDLVASIPPNQLGYAEPLRNHIVRQPKSEYKHILAPMNHLVWFYLLHIM